MVRKRPPSFNPQAFLTKVGSGRTILQSRKNHIIFTQGDAADAVFYIQEGKVKLRKGEPKAVAEWIKVQVSP